jgi:hypothetical protein
MTAQGRQPPRVAAPDRETVWAHILARNPGITAGQAMTADGYRKLYLYTWAAAQRHAEAQHLERDHTMHLPDALRDLFGC